MISESHICSDCKHNISVPVNQEQTRFELCCLKKSPKVNHAGGLTDCNLFKEKTGEEGTFL